MPLEPCREFAQKLSAYMDGELPSRERGALEAHLASCPACSEELRALRGADSALLALPAIEPSPFFAARTAAAAKALDARTPLLRFLRFPLPAAAALTAFIFINIFAFARNIDAMETGPRRELAQKVIAQMIKPSTLINPVAVARLCADCADYMCRCMHDAGKRSVCPCKDCSMHRAETGRDGETPAPDMEADHVY